MIKKDIKDFTLEELKNQMNACGEPSYRARQLFSWLYKKGKNNFAEMSDVPAASRQKLEKNYYIGSFIPVERLKSSDGTEKFLFGLRDSNFIETVLIYSKKRSTVCLSTQVGCKYGCAFCASGLLGFIRNLSVSEIVNQVLFLEFGLKRKITNIVFMGMGEPLDNYENVKKAIVILNSSEGMNMSAGRITVSTCGIVPGIKALKALKAGINLSVSLHAADNRLRNTLMPINKIYPLEEVMMACRSFAETKKGDITFEYVLIKGKNDSLDDAGRLAALAKKVNAKINLLSYSPIPQSKLRPSGEKTIKAFASSLEKKKTKVTLRRSKGADIAAACGQLAVRITSKQK